MMEGPGSHPSAKDKDVGRGAPRASLAAARHTRSRLAVCGRGSIGAVAERVRGVDAAHRRPHIESAPSMLRSPFAILLVGMTCGPCASSKALPGGRALLFGGRRSEDLTPLGGLGFGFWLRSLLGFLAAFIFASHARQCATFRRRGKGPVRRVRNGEAARRRCGASYFFSSAGAAARPRWS